MRPKKVKSEKYLGVYIQKSAVREDDEVYYIGYRDQHGRAYYEKVGWKNEGYTEEEASKVRSARIHEIRHRMPAAAPKCIKIAGVKMHGFFDVTWGNLRGCWRCRRRFLAGAFH